MAAIAATPLFMKDVLLTLKIGAGALSEYQCHVSEARIAVTPGERVDVKTLCATGTFSQVGKPSYSVILSGVQDWADNASVKGLARYLWDNEGQVADYVLQAHGTAVTASATTPSVTGKCTIVPGDYGGTINEYAPLEVELPCVDKPTLKLS
jgi:hypothetical protein